MLSFVHFQLLKKKKFQDFGGATQILSAHSIPVLGKICFILTFDLLHLHYLKCDWLKGRMTCELTADISLPPH